MAHQRCGRRPDCLRHPQSLEFLHNSSRHICDSIQKTLDATCKQCDSCRMDVEDDCIGRVLQSINTSDSKLSLATMTDAHCHLLAEELNPSIGGNIVVEIVKGLRNIELLRNSVVTLCGTLTKRLPLVLDNGLYVFCASFVELTHEDVDEVNQYRDFIFKQKIELTKAAGQIQQQLSWWKDVVNNTQSTLNNLEKLRASLENIRINWHSITEAITEWIKQDCEYPTQLTNRIKRNKEATQDLLFESKRLEETEQHKVTERRHLKLQIEALQKRRRELCVALGVVQRARRFNGTKLMAIDKATSNSTSSPTTDDGRNCTSSLRSRKEFYRRKDVKLDKEENDLRTALKKVNKRISDGTRAIEEEDHQKFIIARRKDEIQIEVAQMKKISADCREILSQRGKVQTFLQLQRGVVNKCTRGSTPFEEACVFVTRRVHHEWPRLYLHLPMCPERCREQRQHDIIALQGFERMNVVLPRNRTPVEDAAAALAKWALLSRRHVDVEGLATGLHLAGWSAWSREVESRWSQKIKAEAETDEASAEAAMETETEDFLPAGNEERCLSESGSNTSSKSQLDRSFCAYEHRSRSRQSTSSKSASESGYPKRQVQNSLGENNEECFAPSLGSTTLGGDEEMEGPHQDSYRDERQEDKSRGSTGPLTSAERGSPTRRQSLSSEGEAEANGGGCKDFKGRLPATPVDRRVDVDKLHKSSQDLENQTTFGDLSTYSSRRGFSRGKESLEKKRNYRRAYSCMRSRANKVNLSFNQKCNANMQEESTGGPSKITNSVENILPRSVGRPSKRVANENSEWQSDSDLGSMKSEVVEAFADESKALKGDPEKTANREQQSQNFYEVMSHQHDRMLRTDNEEENFGASDGNRKSCETNNLPCSGRSTARDSLPIAKCEMKTKAYSEVGGGRRPEKGRTAASEGTPEGKGDPNLKLRNNAKCNAVKRHNADDTALDLNMKSLADRELEVHCQPDSCVNNHSNERCDVSENVQLREAPNMPTAEDGDSKTKFVENTSESGQPEERTPEDQKGMQSLKPNGSHETPSKAGGVEKRGQVKERKGKSAKEVRGKRNTGSFSKRMNKFTVSSTAEEGSGHISKKTTESEIVTGASRLSEVESKSSKAEKKEKIFGNKEDGRRRKPKK